MTEQDCKQPTVASFDGSAEQSNFVRVGTVVSSQQTIINSAGFTFVDLFAGIGGFRIPLELYGGRCVFSSEIDRNSQRTYEAWFGETPHGDITKIPPHKIPDHDFLAAGFPCQPFSVAGVSKKNSLGQAHGFECKAQGTLFFTLASILAVKRPQMVLLENVKNLQSHDKGRTFQIIRETLDKELGYRIFFQIIDAAGYVPQHRERIYIACFDKEVFGEDPPFRFPDPPTEPRPILREILDAGVDSKYTLSDHLWNYLQEYATKHRAKGNGFGFGMADLTGTTRTLSARYHKDGSEILIPQRGKNPRRLTPVECRRLMGFPDDKEIVVSDTQAYRQFGNAVVPKVVAPVVEQMLAVKRWHLGINYLSSNRPYTMKTNKLRVSQLP
ncbi:MAG TPA: DNA (cytosine-5-)-methyltransferase [Pyrinomonadaceae bacterium]|nr:DNA (cytosine-5-)-methyltransferase [Pyrinomonadaceae bacterium]